ncbi:MAG: lysophospholipid acyltransferase family protein [Myxococcota bacterium]
MSGHASESEAKPTAPEPSDSPRSFRARLLAASINGLTGIFARLPLGVSSALARAFGRLWVGIGGPRSRRVRDQLGKAFPENSREQVTAWTRGVFEHLSMGLVELLVLRGGRASQLLDRVEVIGLEHLSAAEAQSEKGGVLVVTGHVGNWELACAKVAALGIPVSVVFRGLREPVLDEILLDLRNSASRVAKEASDCKARRGDAEPGSVGTSPAEVQQIRMGHAGLPVVRALEAGRKVITLLDQDAKREEGVFVPFFGRLASTRSGPIELAMARNVPIVPAFIHRLGDGQRHRIEIGPALRLEDDVLANTQQVTEAIEAAIRARPSQWIWTHRRWRTQPDPSNP